MRFRKYLSWLLIIALFYAAQPASALASTKGESEAAFAARVREGIQKLGTGREAVVKVKLRDKRKVQGYVSQAGEDSFSVTDAKTGATTDVLYGQVAQVKGNNLSTGQKIAIGVVIAAAVVLVIVAAVKASHFRIF